MPNNDAMNARTGSEHTTADVVDWARAKDIFFDALDMAPDERGQYLASIGGDDPGLRSAVRSLLSSHEHATDFLVEVEASTPEPTPPVLPRQIGPYEPIEKLGEGGHGTVYRARQHAPVQRDIALKVLKPGLESADLIARFADERRFLARMDHPDIVTILDAGGTPDGRLFVAMELVEGLPLTEYAEQAAMSTGDRIALTARLCRAVHHAHQRAVMHRDLKPSNVLVADTDDGPRLRIIDFGIARAIADDDADRTVRAIGTPKYMSPEQAGSGSPVDTRTDIYAIGVILCELLTGKTPRPPATGDRSTTRPTPAAAPSRLVDQRTSAGSATGELRGDLDRIVLKAVAWEPDLRYESAAAFADDLDRYLRGEPVRATPPSTVYIARKFAGRHKAGVALSIAAMLLVSVGLALALLGRSEAIRQQRLTETARAEATRQADRSDFIAQFLLEDMLAAADPDTKPGGEITVREVLDAAAVRADRRFADDPALLATVKGTLGVAFSRLGRSADAESLLAEAIELAGEHAPPHSPDHRPDDLLRWRYHHASSMLLLPGRHKDAGREFIQVADDAARTLGPDHPVSLRARLSASEYIEDRGARSEEVHDIELTTRESGFDDLAIRVHALRFLAQQLTVAGEHEEAIAAFREAHGISSSTLGIEHTQTIKLQHRLAESLVVGGEHAEGLTLLRGSLASAVRVFGEGSPTVTGMQRLAVKLFTQGGAHDEAIRLARKFEDAAAEAYGIDSIPHASAGQEVARALLASGDPDAALEEFGRVLPIRERQWGADHAQVGYTWRGIADTHASLGAWAACIDAADRAMSNFGASSPSYYRAGIIRAHALGELHAEADAQDARAALRAQAVAADAPGRIIEMIDAAMLGTMRAPTRASPTAGG